MKTENYEVIFAIVNAGFAEDVMDVAGLAVPEPEKGMISIKKHPKGCFFAARITNNGSKGKNPSYSSFRANAVSRGIFQSGRFYLVLVLFCHVRGFLHSAGAKGLNDMTGGVFCIIGNSSVLSRAERHIGRSLRFRW